MASEVTQETAQEPPKAPEKAQGIKPTEEKSSEQPAISSEPTKLDEPAAKPAPTGTVTSSGTEQESAPDAGGRSLEKESAPPTSGPGPSDLANAPAGEDKDGGKPAEDSGAAATNGDAKTDITMKDGPEEQVNTPIGGQAKRKAEEAASAPSDDTVPEPKKTKLDAAEDPAVPTPATNGSQNGDKKAAGRPKKEKKEPAPVGKTARRTRSQGGPLADA